MIKHVVLIQLKNVEFNIKIKKILQEMLLLPQIIKEIKHIEIGEDISGRSLGYNYLFIMIFENENGLQVWINHQLHEPIRKDLKDISNLLVFDYKI